MAHRLFESFEADMERRTLSMRVLTNHVDVNSYLLAREDGCRPRVHSAAASLDADFREVSTLGMRVASKRPEIQLASGISSCSTAHTVSLRTSSIRRKHSGSVSDHSWLQKRALKFAVVMEGWIHLQAHISSGVDLGVGRFRVKISVSVRAGGFLLLRGRAIQG